MASHNGCTGNNNIIILIIVVSLSSKVLTVYVQIIHNPVDGLQSTQA